VNGGGNSDTGDVGGNDLKKGHLSKKKKKKEKKEKKKRKEKKEKKEKGF